MAVRGGEAGSAQGGIVVWLRCGWGVIGVWLGYVQCQQAEGSLEGCAPGRVTEERRMHQHIAHYNHLEDGTRRLELVAAPVTVRRRRRDC